MNSPPHPLGRERKLVHRHAGVGERGRDRRRRRRLRPLAAALGAVGAGAVGVLDDDPGHLRGHVLDPRHAVIEQGVVHEHAVLVDHLLEQRVAHALQDRALVLALDQQRVDRLADVGDRRHPLDADPAGLGVDADLGGGDADLPEDRTLGVGAAALLGADLALADELAADKAEALGDQLGVAGLAAGAADDPVGDLQLGALDAPGVGGGLEQSLAQVGGGALHGEAGERGRAARSGRAVIRGKARVGALHGHPIDIDRELLSGDLGHHRARSLAHLGGPDVDLDAAVGLHANARVRDRMGAGGQQPDREPAPDPIALRLAPADRRGGLLDVTDQVGVERLAAAVGTRRLARAQQVPAPDLERVDRRPACDLVDLELADPLQVSGAEGAVGAGGGGVRVDAAGVDVDRLPAVGTGGGIARGGADAGAVVGVGAGVEPQADASREQLSVAVGGGPHPAAHAVAARGHHRFLDAVLNPHRTAGLPGERRGDRLHLRVALRAEAAAEVGDDHPHPADRQVEQVGDLGADQERVLAGRPEGDLAVAEVRDHGVGLHRVLIDGGKLVLALDRELPLRLGELDRAGVEPVAVADVALAGRQLAEPVKEPRPQLALVHERGVVGGRRGDRAEHRQLVVVDDDLAQGGLCDRLVLGGDRGHRLAAEADPVDREDRPVLDRVAPVGVEAGELGAGQHGDDPRHPLGGRGVDRLDPCVRELGAQHLAVHHPRHVDVAGELGLAADLRAGVLARARAPDPVGGRGRRRGLGGAHRSPRGAAGSPTSISAASTIDL